jgi:KaiC/GvpD/RAD55 family RecA-like ATPase
MTVHIVDLPPGLEAKWDLADPIPCGMDIEALIASAKPHQGPLRKLIVSAKDLIATDIPPIEFIIEPFVPEASLNMVYAARGIGKTWFMLHMGLQIAMGHDFLGFKVASSRKVLYIDGEMKLRSLQDRLRALGASSNENLMVLPSERLHLEFKPLNVNLEEDQKAIDAAIDELRAEGRGPDVLILDNLSSLASGIDFNDNAALDSLLNWMTKLRHAGVAVIVVHHAGKNGTVRGASRLEDLLDTVIALTDPRPAKKSNEAPSLPRPPGAFFKVEFTKTRGEMPNPSEFQLLLGPGHDGALDFHILNAPIIDQADRFLREIALARCPMTRTALGQKFGVGKSRTSQIVGELRMDCYLNDKDKLTPDGRARLVEVWPELDTRLGEQGELLTPEATGTKTLQPIAMRNNLT